jgi:RNA polymerase sigma-70 factor, ECF subfamily
LSRLLEDRSLLDAFRRGENTALAEVYLEYVRPLYAMIADGFIFKSGNEHRRFAGYRSMPWALENAVQETFVRAFAPDARQSYDGLRPYRNYLFTIARNLIMDQLREEVQGDALDTETEEQEAERCKGSPEERVQQKELAAYCELFVNALDALERALFDARFHDGRSIEETAKQLGISEHHVKAGERRLKKRFFLLMKRSGYLEGYKLDKSGIAKIAGMLLLYAAARNR